MTQSKDKVQRTEKITVRMDKELIKELKKIAKDRERDLSKQIRFMLLRSIKDNYQK